MCPKDFGQSDECRLDGVQFAEHANLDGRGWGGKQRRHWVRRQSHAVSDRSPSPVNTSRRVKICDARPPRMRHMRKPPASGGLDRQDLQNAYSSLIALSSFRISATSCGFMRSRARPIAAESFVKLKTFSPGSSIAA